MAVAEQEETVTHTPANLSWLFPVTIAIIAAAVFISTLSFEFVYDDYAQIVETKQLNSWHMLPHYFTGHVWAWKTPGKAGPYYWPMFMVWLLLNQSLFGDAAEWWHFTNVLMHVLVTLLIYAIVLQLARDRWTAAFAALLFAVHPVHIESVAWVSGITDPLMAALLLGGFLCYIHPFRGSYPLSFVLYAAALLEKETALLLPALVFAYEWLYGTTQRKLRPAIVAVLPYAAVSAIYLAIRIKVLHGMVLVLTPIPWRNVIETWPTMLMFYLNHLVWPVNLSIFYALPVVTQPGLRNFVLPAIALAIVGIGLLLWARGSRLAAFSIVLLILPIIPVLNIRVFAQHETVHDRYLYLPSIGLCILAALALRNITRRSVQITAAGLIAAALAFGTVTQSQHWKDNVTLFQHALTVSPGNEIANQCMGTALLLQGSPADAAPYYQKALSIQPNMFEAAYSLGRSYYELTMYSESEPYFLRAMRLDPRDPKPLLYFGLARMKEGDLKTAEAALRAALKIRGPDDYREYHLSLGEVLKAKGDRAGALAEFQAEARENPDPSRALREISELGQ